MAILNNHLTELHQKTSVIKNCRHYDDHKCSYYNFKLNRLDVYNKTHRNDDRIHTILFIKARV